MSFGGDGWVEDVDGNLYDLNALIVQLDGKIIACGSEVVGYDPDCAVIHYKVDGTRDSAFSNDGKVTIPFGDDDFCHDMAQQGDGKLVVVGANHNREQVGDDDFAVARLEPGGTLDDNSNGDGGFDGDGKLTTGFGADEIATATVVQPDGKIVVLGARVNQNTSYLTRYLPTGRLDGAFGSGGKLTIPTD